MQTSYFTYKGPGLLSIELNGYLSSGYTFVSIHTVRQRQGYADGHLVVLNEPVKNIVNRSRTSNLIDVMRQVYMKFQNPWTTTVGNIPMKLKGP